MPVGKPTIMTENTLKILEEAFSVGASDKEACFLAGISHQTLYNYQQKNPEYVERKEQLKEMPKYKAKKVIVEAIEKGDKQQANWYLERKGKDEGFSTRSEITGKDGGAIETKNSTLDELALKLEARNKEKYIGEASST